MVLMIALAWKQFGCLRHAWRMAWVIQENLINMNWTNMLSWVWGVFEYQLFKSISITEKFFSRQIIEVFEGHFSAAEAGDLGNQSYCLGMSNFFLKFGMLCERLFIFLILLYSVSFKLLQLLWTSFDKVLGYIMEWSNLSSWRLRTSIKSIKYAAQFTGCFKYKVCWQPYMILFKINGIVGQMHVLENKCHRSIVLYTLQIERLLLLPFIKWIPNWLHQFKLLLLKSWMYIL